MSEDDLSDLDDKIRDAQKTEDVPDTSDADSMHSGMTIATEIMAYPVAGGLAGYFLDKFIGTMPLFLLILVMVGFSYGVYRAYKLTNS